MSAVVQHDPGTAWPWSTASYTTPARPDRGQLLPTRPWHTPWSTDSYTTLAHTVVDCFLRDPSTARPWSTASYMTLARPDHGPLLPTRRWHSLTVVDCFLHDPGTARPWSTASYTTLARPDHGQMLPTRPWHGPTVVDCFLQCVWLNQRFTTFTESAPMLVFFQFLLRNFLSVFFQEIFYIPTGFDQKFILRMQHVLILGRKSSWYWVSKP